MDINGIPLFSLISHRMTWLSSRQSVLSENIANSSTPGYVARDLRTPDFQQLLSGQNRATQMSSTNQRHLAIRQTSPLELDQAAGEEGTPTGTVVSLEQKMIKLSDTQLQYQTAANLYQKAVNMFRTAIGGHGNG